MAVSPPTSAPGFYHGNQSTNNFHRFYYGGRSTNYRSWVLLRRSVHKLPFLGSITAVSPPTSVPGFLHSGRSTNQRSWVPSQRSVHQPAFLGSFTAVGPPTSVPGFYYGGQSTNYRSWVLLRRSVHKLAFLGSIMAASPHTRVPGFYYGGRSTNYRSWVLLRRSVHKPAFLGLIKAVSLQTSIYVFHCTCIMSQFGHKMGKSNAFKKLNNCALKYTLQVLCASFEDNCAHTVDIIWAFTSAFMNFHLFKYIVILFWKMLWLYVLFSSYIFTIFKQWNLLPVIWETAKYSYVFMYKYYRKKNEFVKNALPAKSALVIYVSIYCVETFT